jgi:hypothetical protein
MPGIILIPDTIRDVVNRLVCMFEDVRSTSYRTIDRIQAGEGWEGYPSSSLGIDVCLGTGETVMLRRIDIHFGAGYRGIDSASVYVGKKIIGTVRAGIGSLTYSEMSEQELGIVRRALLAISLTGLLLEQLKEPLGLGEAYGSGFGSPEKLVRLAGEIAYSTGGYLYDTAIPFIHFATPGVSKADAEATQKIDIDTVPKAKVVHEPPSQLDHDFIVRYERVEDIVRANSVAQR